MQLPKNESITILDIMVNKKMVLEPLRCIKMTRRMAWDELEAYPEPIYESIMGSTTIRSRGKKGGEETRKSRTFRESPVTRAR